MPVAPSQTRVCNSALAHLGENARINSIDDNNPLARAFLQVWDEAVDEVLVDHPWNVAVKRKNVAVAADVTPAGTQYEQAFEKPVNCLRWLPYRQGHPDYFDAEEEGGYILSNAASPITVRYIERVDDISAWSPGMRECLSAKLARKTAKAITGQTGMIEAMQAVYDDALSKAKRQDGLATGERQRGIVVRSDWLGARNRSWNGPR